jgi:hypothetical protein
VYQVNGWGEEQNREIVEPGTKESFPTSNMPVTPSGVKAPPPGAYVLPHRYTTIETNSQRTKERRLTFISIDMARDVIRGWEILRIAACIDRVLPLINPYIINQQLGRE